MNESQKNWFEISVALPREWAEPVAGYMFELGASAVEERADDGRCVLVTHYPDDDSVNGKVASLGSFLADMMSPALKRDDDKLALKPKMDVRKIKGRNWAKESRRDIKPTLIADDLWVAPSWTPEDELPSGNILWIDPGEAFGTGTHATTRMAAKMLIETIGRIDKPRVLDVGTGTGILAMAAQRAGAAYVLATDNDPKAIEVASDNFKRNGCVIELTNRPLEKISESFHIITANILLETLMDMAPEFKRLLAPDGFVILSGLLVGQRDDMRAKMEEAGFDSPENELTEGEWLAMRYRAP